MIHEMRSWVLFALLLPLVAATAGKGLFARVSGLWAAAWSRLRKAKVPELVATVVKGGVPHYLYADGTCLPAMAGGSTITIPDKPEELEAMLGDSAQVQAMLGDAEAFKEFIGKYAATVQPPEGELSAQVKAQIDEVLKDFAKEHGLAANRLPHVPDAGNARSKLYNPKALGAALDGEWENMAEFAKASWHGTITNKGVDPRLVKNDFSSVIGADGGFLIPEVLRSTLLEMSLETAIVRPRATVIPMDSLRVPFPAIDDTSHASSVFGGIVMYWTPESAALTESQASFARVVLEAKKLTGYCEVPNELLADSIISFEAFINKAYPEALAFFEDVAFLTGNGAGEPLGITDAPALVSQAAEGGQLAATILWENIVKMYSRMLPASLGRAVWVANIDTFPQLALMSLSVGTGGSAIWLNNGTEGPPMTILGRPVIFTEKVPTIGTVGDIMFIDFGYYLIGDRQAVSMASSPHFKFQNDQTVYRIIERVDGRPWLQTALTPRNGTNTLSPFVALATRS
jgi:HK97 family phage major capsid protein